MLVLVEILVDFFVVIIVVGVISRLICFVFFVGHEEAFLFITGRWALVVFVVVVEAGVETTLVLVEVEVGVADLLEQLGGLGQSRGAVESVDTAIGAAVGETVKDVAADEFDSGRGCLGGSCDLVAGCGEMG